MKTIAVIPAYNEEERIVPVLHDVLQYVDHIVVADDGSADNTSGVAHIDERVSVVRHMLNLGKGAGLRTGCDAAIELGADVIVCLDADGQHDASLVPTFISHIEKGSDIVFGSRKFTKDMPSAMRLGNTFLTWMMSKLFSIRVTDTQSGYRAFTRKAYKDIRWESDDYAVETEMLIHAGERKLTYTEIEIPTIYLDSYKGTTPLHGFQILAKMLQWKYL